MHKSKQKYILKVFQTTIHKIDKQQGFTVQRREFYSISCKTILENIIIYT